MSSICTRCGLPEDLCVCEDIAKESQTLTVTTVKKKFGKISTIVSGINQNEVDIKDIAKRLKAKFACGGTAKDGVIEIQGEHIKTIKDALVDLGFTADTIEFKQGPTKGRR